MYIMDSYTVSLFVNFVVLLFLDSSSGTELLSITRRRSGDRYVVRDCLNNNELGNPIVSSKYVSVNASSSGNLSKRCLYQCNEVAPIFREDLITCVSYLQECPSVVSPKLFENFENFQETHSKHETHFISIENNVTGIGGSLSSSCSVIKSLLLTSEGWKIMEKGFPELRLRFYKSEKGRIVPRWLDTEKSPLKRSLEGRLLLFQIFCENGITSFIATSHCISLRIQGAIDLQDDSKYWLLEDRKSANKLSSSAFVGIGVLLAILSFFYLVVSYMYFRIKRYQKRVQIDGVDRLPDVEKGNSQHVITSDLNSQKFCSRQMKNHKKRIWYFSFRKNEDGQANNEEDEEDIYSTPSLEEEIEGRRQRLERLKKLKEANMSLNEELKDLNDYDIPYEAIPQSLCLDIVETSPTNDNQKELNFTSQKTIPPLAGDRNVAGGKTRKKLFFSPSYFEPEMLEKPPPAALEFLSNVREMMIVAKQKIQMKSFQPTLIDIPEQYGSIAEDIYIELSKIKGEKIYTTNKVYDSNNFSTENRSHLPNDFSDLSTYELLGVNYGSKEGNDYYNIPIFKYTPTQQMNENIRSFMEKQTEHSDKNMFTKLTGESDSALNSIYNILPPIVGQTATVKISNDDDSKPNDLLQKDKCIISVKRNRSFKENKEMIKSSVENIKQELQSKIKRVSSLTRIQSFKKNQKQATDKSNDPNYLYMEAQKDKVHRWLHSIDNEDKIADGQFTNNIGKVNKQFSNGDTFLESNGLNFNELSSTLTSLENKRKDETFECQQDKDNEVYTFDINSHFVKQNTLAVNNETPAEIYKVPKNSSILRRFSFDKNFKKNTEKQANSNATSQKYSLFQYVTNLTKSDIQHDNIYEEIQCKENFRNIHGEVKENDCSDENNESVLTAESDGNNSKIHIPGDYSVKSLRKNFLCIDIYDEGLEGSNLKHTESNATNKTKSRRNVKRNDSIVQDSLERPKIKKKLNYEGNITNTDEENNVNICDIPLSIIAKEENLPTSLLNLFSPKTDAAVRRSKTMKTFKDYKRLKFGNSKTAENKLTFFGEGVNLNYCPSKSSRAEESHYQVPVSIKQVKCTNEISKNPFETLFRPSVSNAELPQTHKVRYSNSFSPLGIHKRSEQFQISGKSYDSSSSKNTNIAMSIVNFNTGIDKNDHIYTKNSNDSTETNMSNLNKLDDPNDNMVTQNLAKYPQANPYHLHKLEIGNQRNSFEKSDVKIPNPLLNESSNVKEIVTISGTEQTFETNQTRKIQKLKDKDPQKIELIEESVKKQLERFLRNKTETNEVKKDWRKLLRSNSKVGDKKQKNENNNIDETNPDLNNDSITQRCSNEQQRPHIKKSNSVTHQNSFKKRTSNFINRSVSLHKLAQESFTRNTKLSNNIEKKINSLKFSVYVNDSFSIDD